MAQIQLNLYTPVREPTALLKAVQEGLAPFITKTTPHQLELTWLKDRDKPYDLGECEFHLAFVTDQYDDFYAKHKEMGCVCFENPGMGIYFIADPDGYWIEIVPEKK